MSVCKHSLGGERSLAWKAEDRRCLGARERESSSVSGWGGKKAISERQRNTKGAEARDLVQGEGRWRCELRV